MRAVIAALISLLVAACGTSSTASIIPAAPSPATARATPLTLDRVDFSCRIPVTDVAARDGFVSFPAAEFTPAGTNGGYYYDVAVNRWLPVPRAAVAPSGLLYAYTDGWGPYTAPQLHVVDAATGRDMRAITMPAAQPFAVVDFTTYGVYLMIENVTVAPGVWFADPDTGRVAKVSDGYYVPAGPTWLAVVDPTDPHPATEAGSGRPLPDRVDKRDAAGRISTWFYRPGYALQWSAFAGLDEILVRAAAEAPGYHPPVEWWLVTAPGRATRLNNDTDPIGSFLAGAISDSHGIWLGGVDGLFLVTRGGAILRVFGVGYSPANGCF